MTAHRQVPTSGGFEVDEGIAGVIEQCLRLGVRTAYSCQCATLRPRNGGPPTAWLMLSSSRDARRLARLALDHGDPVLKAHVRPDRRPPGGLAPEQEALMQWRFSWTPWTDEEDGRVAVYLPASDLPLLEAALGRVPSAGAAGTIER